MSASKNLKIAWLFPSLELGNYWHPVFSQFTEHYPQTTIYTGAWTGFAPGFVDRFVVKVVGKMRFVDRTHSQTGYSQGFIYASPAIVWELWRDRPNLIFTTGFCIWTVLVLLFKPLLRWRVIIAYEGSAPGVDYRQSRLRTVLRRSLAKVADGLITNSRAGQAYLQDVLKIPQRKISMRPYEVPDPTALMHRLGQVAIASPISPAIPSSSVAVADITTAIPSAARTTTTEKGYSHPTFLFTGQLIPRKGLHLLLEACRQLKAEGCDAYQLLVAGDGEQRSQLEAFAQMHNLPVTWLGWINYGQLGQYFRAADVFILPTLEDTWGMVILEAMAFAKPVLCSKWAGASELVIDGENGYVFDCHDPTAIATAMRRLIEQPGLIAKMGDRSQQLISQHTPTEAVAFLSQVVEQTMRC
jgi:glycosyltransferase involved in cell wall biosynthesis